jgi:pimeloyl-ACP methyl ester carboxylesterase
MLRNAGRPEHLYKPPARTGGDSTPMTIPNDKSRSLATAAEESVLPVDDGEIYACQDGPRDAPALLLIHGTAVSLRTWDPLVPLLTASHRVIRIDLLGCGRSAKPDGASYAIPDQARRVGAALDRLGVERAIAVGHSSGGLVATALTEQRPGLVTALALIDTGPDMAAYIAEEIAIGPARWPDLTDGQLRQIMSSAFGAGYEIPQPVVDEARDMDLHVFAATSQAVRAYLEEQGLPERLATVGKPLLVIFGQDDRRWRSSSAAAYRAVPGAAVELLPGVGHSPNLEDPPRTAVALLAFTANHAPGFVAGRPPEGP